MEKKQVGVTCLIVSWEKEEQVSQGEKGRDMKEGKGKQERPLFQAG